MVAQMLLKALSLKLPNFWSKTILKSNDEPPPSIKSLLYFWRKSSKIYLSTSMIHAFSHSIVFSAVKSLHRTRKIFACTCRPNIQKTLMIITISPHKDGVCVLILLSYVWLWDTFVRNCPFSMWSRPRRLRNFPTLRKSPLFDQQRDLFLLMIRYHHAWLLIID